MLAPRLVLALTLSAALFTAPAGVRAELDFRDIPAARDVSSARELLSARIARVVDYWSRQRGRPFPRSVGSRVFAQIAAAKLYARRDVASVNRALLDPRAKPYAAYGTRITIIPRLCAREGDYDFMAEELVRLAYSQLSQPLSLWPETAKKIAWELLPEAGARHHWRFRLGLCGRHRTAKTIS